MLTSSESYNEYISRIQNVIKFVTENIAENLDLNSLSRAAFFSPFHFHRIFSAIVKETPLDFVKRIRLEKAAGMLAYSKKHSITEIAFECGFSSSSVFSRAFKTHFGCSATEWKKEYLRKSKNSKTKSNTGKDKTVPQNYFDSGNNTVRNNLSSFEMEVDVKNIPQITVAYSANLEGYFENKIAAAWSKIINWAKATGLILPATKFIGVGFDAPDITPKDKCRYYACISIPENTEVNNGIGKMELKEGKYGVYRFRGSVLDIEKTYKQLYTNWLPLSGYQPADHPCYEVYYKFPNSEPKAIIEMDIFIPIKPF